MRTAILVAAAVLVALPSWADDGTAPTEDSNCVGRHRDEIVAALGPPTKDKRRADGSSVLVYKLVFYSPDTALVSRDVSYGSLGVGPSPQIGDLSPGFLGGDVTTAIHGEARPEVVGKQRSKFVLDANDVVRECEIGPYKRKGRATRNP